MKVKRISIGIAAILCLAIALGACGQFDPFREAVQGSGGVITREIALSDSLGGLTLRLGEIQFRGFADIRLVVDSSRSSGLTLETDGNIAHRVGIDYNPARDEITVSAPRNLVFTPTVFILTIGAPVKNLKIDGAWKISYDCPEVLDCKAEINGAANGEFAFGSLSSLDIALNGACTLTLRGAAEEAALELNGAAAISAYELLAKSAAVTINGTGNCRITASDTLKAVVNGLGSITYDGEPVVSQSINGLGAVKKKAE